MDSDLQRKGLGLTGKGWRTGSWLLEGSEEEEEEERGSIKLASSRADSSYPKYSLCKRKSLSNRLHCLASERFGSIKSIFRRLVAVA